MSKAPDKIYLQFADCIGETTWCEDKINKNDIPYYRHGSYKKELIKKLEEEAVENVNFVKVIRLETAIQLIKETI